MKILKVQRLSSAKNMITHQHYLRAKAGCMDSATKLINDILPDAKIKASIICPVIKQSGNKIPLAMAEKLSNQNPNTAVTRSMLLSNPKSMPLISGRIYSNPEFSGPVYQTTYCLVDDVYTTGKTLIALKKHIEKNGGNVTQVICLGSSKATGFELTKHDVKTLQCKFPGIHNYFDLDLITKPIARYMLRFSSLQALHLKANKNIYSYLNENGVPVA